MGEIQKARIARDLNDVVMVVESLHDWIANSNDAPIVYEQTCSEIDKAIRMLNAIRDRAKLEFITMTQEGK